MKVSVIIPVYNVERYLERCLDSVIAASQGLEVEIIAVNDGSPDNSAAILERYLRSHSIIVVSQENGGLGSARNTGVRVATGDYVMFVDSDDYIPPGAIRAFLSVAENSHQALVVSSSFLKDDGALQLPPPTTASSPRWTLRTRDWIAGRKIQYSAWNKFYRRDLIAERPFPKGLYEDFSWTTSILCDLDVFAVVEEPLYVYCLNQGALSIVRSSYSDRKTDDSIAAIRRTLDHGRGKSAWKFALRQAADGLSSTIGQVYKTRDVAFKKRLLEHLDALERDYPEVLRKISLKARFRLWRLRK